MKKKLTAEAPVEEIGTAPAKEQKGAKAKEKGLKNIKVENGKIVFEYYDKEPEEVGYKTDRRQIAEDLIRNVKNEIAINSKPTPNKELNARSIKSARARLCRIVIKADSISDKSVRELFLSDDSKKLFSNPIVAKSLKAICDGYCQQNNIGGLNDAE